MSNPGNAEVQPSLIKVKSSNDNLINLNNQNKVVKFGIVHSEKSSDIKRKKICHVYDVIKAKYDDNDGAFLHVVLDSSYYKMIKYILILFFFMLSVPNEIFNENVSILALRYTSILNLAVLLLLLIDTFLSILVSIEYKEILVELLLLDFLIIIYCTLILIHLMNESNGQTYVSIFGFTRAIRYPLFLLIYRQFIEIKISVSDELVESQRHKEINKVNDNSMPIDRILKLFKNLKKKIPLHEKEIVNEIDFCFDIISKNNLFAPNILQEISSSSKPQNEEIKRIKEEICFWIQNFTRFEQETNNIFGEIEIRNNTPRKIFNEIDPKIMQENLSRFIPSSNPDEIIKCFKEIFNENFNVFDLKRCTNNQELVAIMYFLFYNNDLLQQCNIRTLKFINFCKKVQSSYRKVPYHNSSHATDVVQTAHYYMTKFELNRILQLTHIERAALLIGGMVHDIDHPGKNNTYLINTNDEIAINYNDKSVLENYHISLTFKIILDPQFNILENLTVQEFKAMRKLMIAIVLCTDLAVHFNELGHFKLRVNALSENEFNVISEEDRLTILSNIIHFADISNQTKNWDVCFKWTEFLYDEFYAQGDVERSLNIPIGFLNDRYKTNIGSAQIGFIDKFISPSFEALTILLPKSSVLVKIIHENKKRWSDLIENYDLKLRELENELHTQNQEKLLL